MTSYYTGAAERARTHEQSEPQVVRDSRTLCERRALAELLALVDEIPAEQ